MMSLEKFLEWTNMNFVYHDLESNQLQFDDDIFFHENLDDSRRNYDRHQHDAGEFWAIKANDEHADATQHEKSLDET